jgi:hypothetical protein
LILAGGKCSYKLNSFKGLYGKALVFLADSSDDNRGEAINGRIDASR